MQAPSNANGKIKLILEITHKPGMPNFHSEIETKAEQHTKGL